MDWLLDELMKALNDPNGDHVQELKDLAEEEIDDGEDGSFWSDPNIIKEVYNRDSWQYVRSANYDEYRGSCCVHIFDNIKLDGCYRAEIKTDLNNTKVLSIHIGNE